MRSTGDTPHAEEGFHYGAFISYRHTDKAWGAWLHKELESYRVPRELVGQTGAYGRVPGAWAACSATARNSRPGS